VRISISCLGDMCPLPLLKVLERLPDLEIGDEIVLKTDHSCTWVSLKNRLKPSKYKLQLKEVDFGIWEITITRIR